MIIKPVFKDKRYIPLWTIEGIDIPSTVTKSILSDNQYSNYDSQIETTDPEFIAAHQGRSFHKDNYNLNLELNKSLDHGLALSNFLIQQEDYYFADTWPTEGFRERLKGNRIGYDFVRDGKNYEQDPHVDNFFLMGSILINLEDNPVGSGTRYYDPIKWISEGKTELVFEGPVKKGTGVIHVNTPNNIHKGWNASDRFRYVAFGNIGI